MDSNIITTLIVVVIIGYGLFMVYTNLKKFIECNKAKKEFLEGNKNHPEIVSDYIPWIIGCVLIAVLVGIAVVYEVQNKGEAVTLAAYGFVTLWVLSLTTEFVVRRTIIFTEDGFFYEKTFHRFRSVNGTTPTGGMFGRYEVRLTTTSEKMQLPKKFGVILKERLDAYQQKRKKKR